MKALTIKQPWASRILRHGKLIENRTWQTGYRGPLVIHSGVRYDHSFPDARRWPKGALGVVQLVGVHEHRYPVRMLDASDPLNDPGCEGNGCAERGGIAGPGLWHWELAEPLPFPEPIVCVGRLGLWDAPEHVERAALDLIEKGRS